jgi:hypothetical protein
MCGEYDCGADSYHESARRLFEKTKAAIQERIPRLRSSVFHVYGDGSEGDDDPENRVDSPIEALEKRADAGFTHVVDIPYEFDSDSRDTLIVLRGAYGRPIPDWNDDFESRFGYKGLDVKISNSSFGAAKKTRAFYDVIVTALEKIRNP